MTVAHGIRTLGVLGAGQMGTGIVLVSALRAKVPVLVYDRSRSAMSSSMSFLDKLLQKDVAKSRITSEEAKSALERVKTVESMGEMRDVDMVIEAVSENFEVKKGIFGELTRLLGPNAILASNTSTSEPNAGRVVGLHFFNPVPVMKLVELISALQTTPDTLSRAKSFAVACGKTVTTSQDVPGFVANALLMPYINEAILHLEKGVATREDIDTTMKLGMNHPMGPLELADFIGLDTCLAIQQTLYEGTSDSKYRPSVLLERMVDAGWVGKKGGKGFYDY
ncbi:3-hydroxyacyl-CoA dehydrogenase [Mycena floridula]|nr:3-hydroxyacyl-CoA dehydrogenase [Mycena floridula]